MHPVSIISHEGNGPGARDTRLNRTVTCIIFEVGGQSTVLEQIDFIFTLELDHFKGSIGKHLTRLLERDLADLYGVRASNTIDHVSELDRTFRPVIVSLIRNGPRVLAKVGQPTCSIKKDSIIWVTVANSLLNSIRVEEQILDRRRVRACIIVVETLGAGAQGSGIVPVIVVELTELDGEVLRSWAHNTDRRVV